VIRSARTILVSLLLLALAPATASADGLGGLGALRGLLYAAIGFVALLFVAGWAIAFIVQRGRVARVDMQTEPGTPPEGSRPYWLFDREFPIGLRVLRVVQYGLAFPYAISGLIRLMVPSAYHNDHIAEFVLQWIAFCAGFTVLAILSANAYSHRGQPRGWKLGVALGWLCVGNAVVGTVWHGAYEGFDPISATFGAVLLGLMQLRYRSWFGCETTRPWLRKSALGAGMFAGLVVGLLAVFAAISLVVTGPLQLERDEAHAHVRAVRIAVQDYYAEHGEWPATLGDLPADVDLRYRWKRVQYDRDEPSVYMDVHIPLEPPSLAFRLTFGRAGFTPAISKIGGTLRPRGETAASR